VFKPIFLTVLYDTAIWNLVPHMMKNIFPAGQRDSFLVPLIEIINFKNNHAYYFRRVPQ